MILLSVSTDSIHELLGCLYESATGSEGRSAQVVLGHLTRNAKELFNLLLKHQLEPPAAVPRFSPPSDDRPSNSSCGETSLRCEWVPYTRQKYG